MASVFISQFRNLSGSTLGEKKRNLNALFSASAGISPTVLAQIAEELEPKTALEKLFFTEFLLHFQVFPQLYRQFLACDELTLAKVAKKPWFFQRVFEQAGPEFVTELFPKIGRRLKLKFLNKIELNEAQADAIYDVISTKYGEGLALQVLTKCSPAKIEALIQKHYLKLWPAHLKLLYKKNPQLIYVYLNEIVKNEGEKQFSYYFFDRTVVKVIAKNDIKMLLDLKEKYKLHGHLFGKRTVKRMVDAERDNIVSNPEKYLNLSMNKGKFFRRLGKDSRTVYAKAFPKKLYEVARGSVYLKYYPKTMRSQLFTESFQEAFQNLKPESITEDLLRAIPDADLRASLARAKAESAQTESDEHFIQFYDARDCIETIKNRWNFARSTTQRQEYIEILIETCILHEDYESLAGVLEFLLLRTKNDFVFVRQTILRTLASKRCDYSKLDGRHWKSLLDLISASDLKQYYKYDVDGVFFKYIWYEQPENMCEQCSKFFGKDSTAAFNYTNHVFVYRGAVNQERDMLTCFAKNRPEEAAYSKSLILACVCYNSRCKAMRSDPIDFSQEPFLSLVSTLEVDFDVSAVFDSLMRSEVPESLAKVFWANLEHTASVKNITWFLNHKPDELMQNFETLLESVKKAINLNVWRLWKDFSYFLELTQRTVQFCSAKLHDSAEDKAWLALPLSILADDYLNLMQPFKPVSDKNDNQDELNFQKALIKHLKNTSASVPAILEFCRGDYLAEALVPLCSALYKLPEDEAKPHLEALQKMGAVSVKKHGLFLSCALLDQAPAISAIKSSKLQPQSLTSALKYFQRNPTEAAFEVVKMKLPKVNKNDKFTNKLIVDVVASSDYRGRYFDSAWSVLNETGNIQWKKVLLTKAKEGTLTRLSAETLAKVIESDFMKAPKMDEFTTNVLFYSSNHEPVYQALERFKRTEWESDFQSRKKLSQFIETFSYAYMTRSQSNSELIESFAGRLQAIFEPFEAYEELAIANLMKYKGKSLDSLAAFIVELNSDLIAQYGQASLNIFADCLKKFLVDKWGRPIYPESEKEKLELLRKILEARKSLDDALLVVKLLPEAESEDLSAAAVYGDLMAALESIQADSLKLHLNLYFKSSEYKGAETKRQGPEPGAL